MKLTQQNASEFIHIYEDNTKIGIPFGKKLIIAKTNI